LEAQLRELRVAVKYVHTFAQNDAIVAALVPEDGKLAILYPDGIIKLRALPPIGLQKTSGGGGCPGRRSESGGSPPSLSPAGRRAAGPGSTCASSDFTPPAACPT
jgi:hypothetical protein